MFPDIIKSMRTSKWRTALAAFGTTIRARADRCYSDATSPSRKKELAADGESCGEDLTWSF